MKRKNKGFTLIELLAVVAIIAMLMVIAIPSITKYITESRKKTLMQSIENYVSSLNNQVNNMEYIFTGTKVTMGGIAYPLVYAVPIECIPIEKGGTDPFGEWYQANEKYWAYVLVQYNDATSTYSYGFTFRDSAGYGMYPTETKYFDEKGTLIKQKLAVAQPINGSYRNITEMENWKGFNIKSGTYVQVLEAAAEGSKGDNKTTCTLQRKGKNYDEIDMPVTEGYNIDDYTLTAIEANTTVSFWKYRKQIKTITFQDKLNIPTTIADEYKWDVSVTGKGKVMAYVTPNASDPAYYDLYIQGDGKIYANPDSSFLFDEFRYVDRIDLNTFDTSRVKDMTGMFYATGYYSTTFTINLGTNFDTSNVINMEQLFNQMGYNSTVFTLDLGNKFDTSNVTNMHKMFWHLGYSSPVFTLDLGDKFNTSKVTKMKRMLGKMGYSNSEFRLDCSGWDVSNVEDYSEFFVGDASKVILPSWPETTS